MKTLKLTLVAGLLTVAATASAQFANTGSQSTTTVDTGNYDRITISYNPQTLSPDWENADNMTFNGFTVGYTKGISISQKYPLFVEVGVRLNYSFWSEDGEIGFYYYDEYDDEMYHDVEEGSVKTNYLNLSVPVNLAYKFAVGNVYVTPFTGITLKANLLSKNSYELDDDDYDIKDTDNFDKKDVGKDGQWKRFQIGWQIGAGVDFNNYYVGLHYGLDFSEIAKKVNSSNWAITLGYNF